MTDKLDSSDLILYLVS